MDGLIFHVLDLEKSKPAERQGHKVTELQS